MNHDAIAFSRTRCCRVLNCGALWALLAGVMVLTGCFFGQNGRDSKVTKGDYASLSERIQATNEALASAQQPTGESFDAGGGPADSFATTKGAIESKDSNGFNALYFVYIGLGLLVLIWLVRLIVHSRRERREPEPL